jgi:phage terminase small subunit
MAKFNGRAVKVQVELRFDDDGVARFCPVNGSISAASTAQRYNRVLDEWVTAGSLTGAARKAGYVQAERVVNKLKKLYPQIVDEVKRRRTALIKKVELSQEAVVLELARIAFSNIGRIVAWEDGKPVIVDSNVLDDDTIAAIQEIGADAEGRLKIKMYDKKGALVDLGKFMGLGDSDNAHLTALLARLAGASEGEVIDAQRLDSRETARRVALLLRKGRALTKA